MGLTLGSYLEQASPATRRYEAHVERQRRALPCHGAQCVHDARVPYPRGVAGFRQAGILTCEDRPPTLSRYVAHQLVCDLQVFTAKIAVAVTLG